MHAHTHTRQVRIIFRELYRYLHIRCTYGTSIPYITNIWNILEIANIIPFIAAWTTRIVFATDPLGALPTHSLTYLPTY